MTGGIRYYETHLYKNRCYPTSGIRYYKRHKTQFIKTDAILRMAYIATTNIQLYKNRCYMTGGIRYYKIYNLKLLQEIPLINTK